MTSDNVLLRASTPDGAKQLPVVSVVGDRAQLQLVDSGVNGASAVDVALSDAVRWQVRLVAGSTDLTMDLAGGLLSGIEFIGGVSSIDLVLPQPDGSVPVTVAGGVGRWTTHLPKDVPVRFSAQAGAGSVTVDGTVRSGVSAGTVIEPDGWAGAKSRYDLVAATGVGSAAVDRR